jgi:dipeptidyl aminopeptidase/acylaminoacyl peptidase
MRSLPLCVLALCAAPLSAAAQEGYRLPPAEVVKLVDTAAAPQVSFSPDGEWMLLVERDALPPIADLSRRMLRLAGMRIDPAANSRFTTSYNRALTLRPTHTDKGVQIPLGKDARLASISWSHDSSAFAYTLVTDAGTELWGASLTSPTEPKRLAADVSTVTGGAVWMPDGSSLLCRLVPADRGREPQDDGPPQGPNIRSTSGSTSPLRTYQDLLSSQHDAALFDYYAKSQLARVAIAGGAPQAIGKPGLYGSVSASPDGRYLLVTRYERPYSYLMPWSSFPHRTEVWDLEGRVVREVEQAPLAENIPLGGVRLGRRSVSWKSSEGAALVWVEALDGGDPKVEVPHRDRWFTQAAPFDGEPSALFDVENRARGLTWFEDPELVASSEYDRDRRWTRTQLRHLGNADGTPRTLEDRSVSDRYGDPGRLLMERQPNGRALVRQDGDWVYRSGAGASPTGSRPYLDRQNIKTLETERVWRSSKGTYESIAKLLPTKMGVAPAFITRHETPNSPPNYRLHGALDEPQALTSFPDPQPELRGVHKELVTYTRPDGVPLSATLYLPAGYEEGTRLPLIVWAYPREFNDVKTAGQVGATPTRFTRISGSSHLHLLTQGYAIMDGATIPIIGDPETMNDTFVEQLVAGAKAAIDFAVERGVADRSRVGVGGHSYGAFMTANLLAHCDLFQAGLARSGAYNRTLTPFGFQSERRTLWEAPDAYFRISPFMHAHKINEPLLMTHGEIDNNSGTFPIQSQRLFQAIKGNGGTARLVMLPHESHGYRGRESVLHVLAETIDWFDQYVKGAGAVEAAFEER